MTTAIQNIQNNLKKWFFGFWVKKWKFSFLLMWIIVVWWLFSAYSIPKESSPDIDFGIITITTIYPWVNPGDMDTLVTEKIEQAVKDIDWINKISSISAVGFAKTTLEFNNDADVTQWLVDTQDAVDQVSLPTDAEDPSVTKVSSDNQIMFMALLYDGKDEISPLALREKARIIKANLDGKWGINRIDIWWSVNMHGGGMWLAGDASYEIQVLVDKDKVEVLWISLLQITQTIQRWNKNQPLWNHTVWDLNYDFRLNAEIEDISQLGETPISTRNGFVYLRDIATIGKKLKNETQYTLGAYNLSGQSYVSLTFNKAKWVNLFQSAKEAKELLADEMHKIWYQWLNYRFSYDLSELIDDDYQKLAKNWLQTLILVFLALLLFIGFKEALIATIVLPLAFLITFMVLRQLGLSLNFLTNFSFIISFGIAIDTTIVVIEWAHERARQWFKPINAILLAIRDYKMPLIAGTSTTLVVFLPMLSLPGVMGKFLAFIPITIFSTLLAALMISLTLNSALYYKLSKKKKYFEPELVDEKFMITEDKILLAHDTQNKKPKPEHIKNLRENILDKVAGRYKNQIEKIMKTAKSRAAIVSLSILAFILSMVVIPGIIWFKLFPDNDNNFLDISISSAKWSTNSQIKIHEDKIEQIISSYPEVKVYSYSLIDNTLHMTMELWATEDRQKKWLKDVFDIEAELNEKLWFLRSYGLKVEVAPLKDWPMSWKAIGVKLIADKNDKFELLLETATAFERYLKTLPGAKNAGISSQVTPWQFVFGFDLNKLSLLWISPGELTLSLFAATNWLDAGSIKGTYDEHDIKVKYAQFENSITATDISNLSLTTTHGPISMGSVSDYSFVKAIWQIIREDTKLTVNIEAELEQWVPSNVLQQQLLDFAKDYNYPDGVSFSTGWENEANGDLLQALMIAFVLSMMFIYGILLLQFDSYTQPLTIMISILMGIFGANIGLWVTGNPYSMMFVIGLIALIGIVVNDAIVFLDRANHNIEKWMERKDAVLEAWKARLHPIILTTMTTILGLLSIVTDGMREPLAVTIIFGLFFGSAMTLLVIPAIYYDHHKITIIIKRLLLRPLIILSFLVVWLWLIWTVWFLFQIKLWENIVIKPVLFAVSVLYLIWYSFYALRAQENGKTDIASQRLGLRVRSIDWKPLHVKQILHRWFLKKLLRRGPAVLYGALITLLWDIVSAEFILKTIKLAIGSYYIFIIVFYLYRFWSSENDQMFHDELSGVMVG